MPEVHWPYIIWFFLLGSCVGSFLNVVIWRLPRGMSLVKPASHCPQCERPLAWYDNIPIFGWILLRGRCRYCGKSISPRYPIVEACTAGMFVLMYVMFFIYNVGPTARSRPLNLQKDWPIFSLYLYVACALLASSLIDIESMTIVSKVFWWMAILAAAFHASLDRASMPGSLSNIGPAGSALAAGALAGFLLSLILHFARLIPQSFPRGEPLLEIDRQQWDIEVAEARKRGEDAPQLPPEYTPAQLRREISKEMLFLMPPLILGAAWVWLTMPGRPLEGFWLRCINHVWLRGLLGSVLGGLTGAFLIWLFRILGTLGFGRIGMGLGDADLMLGVGAALGCGRAVLTFFLAPFFGMALAIYLLIRRRRHEIPYGPYLSMAAIFLMFCYDPIADKLRPGLIGFFRELRLWL